MEIASLFSSSLLHISNSTSSLQHQLQQQHQNHQNFNTSSITAMSSSTGHILTLSCPDKPGIVHAVTGIFASKGHNVLDLQQYSDPATNQFFMRVHFGPSPSTEDAESTAHLEPDFQALAAEYAMKYNFRPLKRRTRVLIMVSKIGHCLNDLLFRMKTGQLLIDVPIIVSNHPDFEPLAKSYGIEFHHLPVTKDTKQQQETQVLELIKQHNIELVVLARYMQVLSPRLCEAMSGKIINSEASLSTMYKYHL